MSEHRTEPADPTGPGQHTRTGVWRVRGSLPACVTVVADDPDQAADATPATVSAAFADLPGSQVTTDPVTGAAATPVAGQPGRYDVAVTVRGHLDVAADLDGAVDTARAVLAHHIDARDDLTADLDEATCHEVVPADTATADD
jgi:hypothetical protein